MAAVDRIAYQDLAPVYDYLVPEVLLTPEGNVAMFEEQVAQLELGAARRTARPGGRLGHAGYRGSPRSSAPSSASC